MPRTASSRASRRRPASRVPNYGSAGRMMRALVALLRSPHGRELGALADELSISRKTAERYVISDAVVRGHESALAAAEKIGPKAADKAPPLEAAG